MTISNTTFLHFNDVYNVEKSPPFVTSLKNARKEIQNSSNDGTAGTVETGGARRRVLTVFSGDAFSPSILSTILRGVQMVPALNALDIDVACLGNHDLDFGIEEFRELKNKCNFPWLCSNAWDARSDEPLGGCREYLILDDAEEGTGGSGKILFIGLVEGAWLDTLATLDPSDVIFEEPIDFVKRRVPELTKEFGPFEAVVAVSHMRMPNDIQLANEAGSKSGRVGGVDLILGGHDHHYEDIVENGVRILNSGADFKCFTVIDVLGRSETDDALQTASRKVSITPHDTPDASLLETIQQYKAEVDASMDVVVGCTKVALDARFAEIRTRETNMSNFLAELMTRSTGADAALLNAGTIRADRFIDKGKLTMRDLCDLLPMADETAMIEVTAERLLLALENGVSQYPAMEGRFPCVHGVRFAFDPSKPAGSRVVPGSVYVKDRDAKARPRHTLIRGKIRKSKDDVATGNENGMCGLSMSEVENGSTVNANGCPKGYSPIDHTRSYSLVTKAYLVEGKDGFDSAFVGAPLLRDSDECPLLPTVLRNVFTELRTLEMWRGLVTNERKVIEAASKFKSLTRNRKSAVDPYAINPCVDGRIRNLAEEEVKMA